MFMESKYISQLAFLPDVSTREDGRMLSLCEVTMAPGVNQTIDSQGSTKFLQLAGIGLLSYEFLRWTKGEFGGDKVRGVAGADILPSILRRTTNVLEQTGHLSGTLL